MGGLRRAHVRPVVQGLQQIQRNSMKIEIFCSKRDSNSVLDITVLFKLFLYGRPTVAPSTNQYTEKHYKKFICGQAKN